MPATGLDARSCAGRRPDETGGSSQALLIRQTAAQWAYVIAWFGLLFVVLPFLLRPEDWREKLWISAGFLVLIVIGHVTTYTAVRPDGLTVGRWFARTSIAWSGVTGVEVTGRVIKRVCVVSSAGTTVLPAPTSGPLNWDRRFTARAALIQAAAAPAGTVAPLRTDGPGPVPRPRTPQD